MFRGQEVCLFDRIPEPGDEQLRARRPVKHVKIESCAFGTQLLSAAAPGKLFKWTGLGCVNGFSVDFHPSADFSQALDARLGEQPFGGWPHIQEVISAFAGAIDEV